MYDRNVRQQRNTRDARDPRRVDPRRARQAPPPPPPKKKKRFNKEKFFLHVKTFFVRLAVMLLVVSLLGFWWYRSVFFSDDSARSGKVTFLMEDVGEYTVKASKAYRKDVLYVDFTEVSEWLGMVSVGSIGAMRFICADGTSETSSGKGGEEYAIFTDGSTTAIVNGESVTLEAESKTVDTHIWIPLSFVENYVSGIVTERDAKGYDIVFSPPSVDGEDKEESEEIVIDAAFKVKGSGAIAHVEYPE